MYIVYFFTFRKTRNNFTNSEFTTIISNDWCFPFNKSIKLAQVNGTNTIVVFSDMYDPYESVMWKLIEACGHGGIEIVPFIKKYKASRLNPQRYDIDLKKVKMICSGYKYLYRGILYGFYIN